MTQLIKRLIPLVVIAAVVAAPALRAQDRPLESRRLVGRAALEARVTELDSVAHAAADPAVRERAANQARLIRERLAHGDFSVGDRVLLTVAGESTLTDTFTVREGRALELPGIGSVPLSGVLRMELADYLTDTLAVYVRNPFVRARALVQLSVVGEVERPGFYAVPTDALLSHVLMQAGGLTRDADASNMRVERRDRKLIEGGVLEQAIAGAQTIDDLALQAGDRLVVPRQSRMEAETWVRLVGLAVGLPVAIYGTIRLFSGSEEERTPPR